ncbi:phage tail protein [Cognatishimia sp. F0-27]|nr:phage tail protein [Cognatishimia sp. F0-27]
MIGQITYFGFNWCPRSWAKADGQLLAIAQNQALFSLIGTIYGGDGRTTFALPDLRGRSAVNYGQGPGLSNLPIGGKAGAETVTLNAQQMPAHNHAFFADEEDATTDDPNGGVLAITGENVFGTALTAPVQMNGSVIGNAGNNASVPIRDPYLAVTACIALQGIYPSRS